MAEDNVKAYGGSMFAVIMIATAVLFVFPTIENGVLRGFLIYMAGVAIVRLMDYRARKGM